METATLMRRRYFSRHAVIHFACKEIPHVRDELIIVVDLQFPKGIGKPHLLVAESLNNCPNFGGILATIAELRFHSSLTETTMNAPSQKNDGMGSLLVFRTTPPGFVVWAPFASRCQCHPLIIPAG